MNKKYILRSPIQTALFSRLLAKLIDFAIMLFLSMFFYPIGVLLAMGYLCVCDFLQNGQSMGKRFIGMAVISLEDGTPCSLRQSIIRNLPFLAPCICTLLPVVGFVFAFVLGLPLLSLELYLLVKLDSGKRLGDVMADTTVIANDRTGTAYAKKRKSWFDPENIIPPLGHGP